jgi:hypothetical protein
LEDGCLIFQRYYDGEYDSGWYNTDDNDEYIITEDSDFDEWKAGDFLGALTDELSVKGSYDDLVPLIDISSYAGKPQLLTISTCVAEFVRENGIFIVDDKKIEGYSIYENETSYNFLYNLNDIKSAEKALLSIQKWDIHGYNSAEKTAIDKLWGVTYYDNMSCEIDGSKVSQFSGYGDQKIEKIAFSYPWDVVTLEMDSGEKFSASDGGFFMYDVLIMEDIGKIILEFLKKAVYI